MFDLDAGKLLIIGIVALLVIPPKDLPSVMRQVGQMVGKLRRMASDFQSQFMEAIRDSEFDEVRKNVTELRDSATRAADYDPVAAVRDELKQALGEGAPAANAAGTGTIAAETTLVNGAVASDGADASPVPAEMKSSKAAASNAAAVESAPTPGSEPASVTAPPQATATVSGVQPPAEPAAVAQEADARRS